MKKRRGLIEFFIFWFFNMYEIIKKYLLYLKLLLVAMFFGGTFIAGRVLSQNFPPFTSSFLRFSFAAVLLMLFLFLTYSGVPPIDGKSMIKIFFLALTGIIGYNFFFFSGLKLIDASRASVIVSLNPASISIFSFLLFRENLHPLKIAGIMLSFLGALIVITRGEFNLLFSGSIGAGELYILDCVACWTAFSLIGKSIIEKIPPLAAIAIACLIGALILIIPAWQEGCLIHIANFGIDVWISVLVLALLGTGIAYVWY